MKRIRLIKLDEEISKDLEVYSEEARDALVEEDELSSVEAGFMKGWEDAV
ncbi:hypothetical protein ACFL6I_13855 [candidate division KSB1 bacterium]